MRGTLWVRIVEWKSRVRPIAAVEPSVLSFEQFSPLASSPQLVNEIDAEGPTLREGPTARSISVHEAECRRSAAKKTCSKLRARTAFPTPYSPPPIAADFLPRSLFSAPNSAAAHQILGHRFAACTVQGQNRSPQEQSCQKSAKHSTEGSRAANSRSPQAPSDHQLLPDNIHEFN